MTDELPSLDRIRAFEGDLPPDEAFRALSDPYARYALSHLHGNPTTSLDALADVVTALEATATETIATPSDRDRVRVHLHHATLPKLDALGYVAFDPDEGTVIEADVPPAVYALLGAEDLPSGTDGGA
jgi:hypothetical protein